ncbi:inhibitor of apoptosis-promoting Bax1-domain-containing protein [Scleroderma citrinum]
MSSTSYPVPPPSYQATGTSKAPYIPTDATEPLLGRPSSPGGRIYDQPEAGDLPDDFKYGVTVSESALEVQAAFVRKVYTILFCQILATTIVAGCISQSFDTVVWITTHPWSFYVPLFGTLINMGLLYWKRHSHPWNLVLLSTFTLMEAFTLGVATAFVDNVIVLQALLITLGVFLGLTLFTLQSKYDFSGLGPWLFGGIIALMMTGIVGIFIPFSHTVDLVYAILGCLIFSGYIVFDTYMIMKRLSPDEYIVGSLSLYLE